MVHNHSGLYRIGSGGYLTGSIWYAKHYGANINRFTLSPTKKIDSSSTHHIILGDNPKFGWAKTTDKLCAEYVIPISSIYNQMWKQLYTHLSIDQQKSLESFNIKSFHLRNHAITLMLRGGTGIIGLAFSHFNTSSDLLCPVVLSYEGTAPVI